MIDYCKQICGKVVECVVKSRTIFSQYLPKNVKKCNQNRLLCTNMWQSSCVYCIFRDSFFSKFCPDDIKNTFRSGYFVQICGLCSCVFCTCKDSIFSILTQKCLKMH